MSPRWMKITLLAAGLHDLAWGAATALAPHWFLGLFGLHDLQHAAFWRGIGLLAILLGIGYIVASGNPLRRWPIIAIGLLIKFLGPLGFLAGALTGGTPWSLGWSILVGDVLWWVPFAIILWQARKTRAAAPFPPAFRTPESAMAIVYTQDGRSLDALSREHPVLVVFLRHAGCTFCREALADISANRADIEQSGTTICLVHMTDDKEEANAFFSKYGLGDVPRIADPDRHLYRAFGLKRGGIRQLIGLQVVRRGIEATFKEHHVVGRLAGDGLQMPGVFLLHEGRILRTYRHEHAAARPDYQELAGCTLG